MQHIGQEGFIYTVNDDGTYTLTDAGMTRFADDPQVPEELGGGSWTDGNNQINQWLVASIEMNPETGETFGSDYWASISLKKITQQQTKSGVRSLVLKLKFHIWRKMECLILFRM